MRPLARLPAPRFRGSAHALRSVPTRFTLVEPFPNGKLYFKRAVDRPVSVYVLGGTLVVLASAMQAFSMIPLGGRRFHLTRGGRFFSPGDYLDDDTCLPTSEWSEARAWEAFRLADPPELDSRERDAIAAVDRLSGRLDAADGGDAVEVAVRGCLASLEEAVQGRARAAPPAADLSGVAIGRGFDGSVDLSRRSRAAGWAARGKEATTVSVFVNGARVGEAHGTGERPDVIAAGFARHSAWSFDFDPPLGPGDHASFRFPDGSPVRVAAGAYVEIRESRPSTEQPAFVAKRRAADSQRGPKYKASVVVCVRWECDSIVEWVEYHRYIGFEHFFIYCNDDNPDDLYRLLRPLMTANNELITFRHFPIQGQQLSMYMHFFDMFAEETEWVIFLDADEFLNLRGMSIAEFLQTRAGGIDSYCFNWLMFGNNAHLSRPIGSVLKSYTRRACNVHPYTKAIVRTARVDPDQLRRQSPGGFWHAWSKEARSMLRSPDNPLGLVETNVIGTDMALYYRDFPREANLHVERDGQAIARDAVIHHYFLKSVYDLKRRVARGTLGSFAGQTMWQTLADGPDLEAFLSAVNAVEDRSLAELAERLDQVPADVHIIAPPLGLDADLPRGFGDRAVSRLPDGSLVQVADDAHPKMEPDTAYLGSVDLCRATHATGWAARGDEPAVVGVHVNGQLVGEAPPFGERPDVAAAGYARYSGWSFVFPSPLRANDRLEFRFADGSLLPLAAGGDHGWGPIDDVTKDRI